MLVFYNSEPCLNIKVEPRPGSNFQVQYGLHRDRQPDSGWPELRWTTLSEAKSIEETDKLKQTLLEDLAYTYGSNTPKFIEKLKEFKII